MIQLGAWEADWPILYTSAFLGGLIEAMRFDRQPTSSKECTWQALRAAWWPTAASQNAQARRFWTG